MFLGAKNYGGKNARLVQVDPATGYCIDSFNGADPGRDPTTKSMTARMFEPPPPSRLGIDHNWCLYSVAGFSFPDNANKETPRIPGNKWSYKCAHHALGLGLLLVEDERGWIRTHDSVAPAGYIIDWRECNVYGERGWTAAHAAAFNGQKETLLLLLAHGWSCDLPDREGKTVIGILEEEGYEDLAMYCRRKYIDPLTPKERKKQLKERLRRERERFEKKYHIEYDEFGRGMIV